MNRDQINQLLANLDADTLAAVAVLIQAVTANGSAKLPVQPIHIPASTANITLKKAIENLLQAKRLSGLREGYLHSLRGHLRMFADGQEERSISGIGVEDVEQWLSVRCKSLGYRSTCINRLSSLFSFAVRRRWMSENPCSRIERIRQNQTTPTILTVEQARKLLNVTRAQKPCALAYLCLTMLAGVRPEEAIKLTWAHINLDAGTIHMDGVITKTRQRRIVPLHPNAVAWLAVSKAMGSTLPLSLMTRRRNVHHFREVLGMKAWPKDILRHTTASYWLAETQDAGKVARWLGNSAGVLLKHYVELTPREEAVKFWSIMP